MKKLLLVACLVLIAMSGCRSVSSVTESIAGTNDSLLTQVPQEKMAHVDEARFQLSVAEEKVKLAGLREDLADEQEKLGGRELTMAKNLREQREIELDLAKAEAIAAANLTDSLESAKQINGYKQELLKNEADRIDIEAKIRKLELTINDLKERIRGQEQHIATMTNQAESVDPGMAPSDDAGAQPAEDTFGSAETEEQKEEVTLPEYLKVEEDPDAAQTSGEGSAVEEGALPE